MRLKNPFKSIFRRGVSDPWHWITRIVTAGSAAGVDVTADNALKVSAVYACIKVIAETLASLPLILYERVGDGKQPAQDHPLYRLMHDSPNDYLTSYEFREILLTHLCLRGNHYSQKIGNSRGLKSLIPLNPANMDVSLDNGRIVYLYTYEDASQKEFSADQIWHVKNMPISTSYNGIPPEGLVGVSPISVARESVGLALAADEYGGRYFSNNATVGLNFQYPGKLDENAKNFLRESLAEYGKLENKFKSIITEEGGKIERLGISNEDSQFLESRQFQIEEIARIFRVPPVLIGHPTNTMTYASAEQIFLSFAKFTVQPWCLRLEHSMNKHLLSNRDQEKYFFEFKLDSLLRADTKTRYEAYGVARQWGWMSTNEIRALENMNPVENGDIYLQPLNMVEAGTPPPTVEPALDNDTNEDDDEKGNA